MSISFSGGGTLLFVVGILLLVGLGDLAYRCWHVKLKLFRVVAILLLLLFLIVRSTELHSRFYTPRPKDRFELFLAVIVIVILVILEVFHIKEEAERRDRGQTVTARVASIEELPARNSDDDTTQYLFYCVTEDGVYYSTKTTREFSPDVIGKRAKLRKVPGDRDNYEIFLDTVGEDESQEEARQQYAREETIRSAPGADSLSWRWDDRQKR